MQQAQIVTSAIRERRSVKIPHFKAGVKIPGDIIDEALTNATWAPNHGRTEPWQFIVYTGSAIEQLCVFQSELYKKESGEKFTEAKYQKLKCDFVKASHVIAICLKRDAHSKFPEIEEISAVAAAVQNFALTLHAHGYGGYWTTGGVTYYESAKPYFDLKENDKLMGFYVCGVVDIIPAASPRKPISEKVVWVK